MLSRYVFGAGLTLAVGAANGQTTTQGDSTYRGLQVNRTTQDQVVARLGRQYISRELMGETLAKLRGGGCITRRYKAGVELYYKQLGVTCRISYRNHLLGELVVDSTANIVSAKGIQPGRHRFGDVASRYGDLVFDKSGNGLPRVQEISVRRTGEAEERWFVVIVYPSITFVSPGRRQPGEDLQQRLVTELWLRNE